MDKFQQYISRGVRSTANLLAGIDGHCLAHTSDSRPSKRCLCIKNLSISLLALIVALKLSRSVFHSCNARINVAAGVLGVELLSLLETGKLVAPSIRTKRNKNIV